MTEPHVHADPEFQDLETSDSELSPYHLAYRFLPADSAPRDNHTRYLPLNISFGADHLDAQRWTLLYGMQRDFWSVGPREEPTDQDRATLMRLALDRLAEDIKRVEAGDMELLEKRILVGSVS